MDIQEFYEWASHHFALDEFYEDAEDLIDHIKFIISSDNIHLFNDKKYKFIQNDKIQRKEILLTINLVAIVIQNGMKILGVSLPKKM